MKRWKILLPFAIFILILAACNNDTNDKNKNGNNKEAKNSSDGITISIATSWPDWMLEERVSDPIAEVYPDIIIEHLPVYSQEDMEELIANKNIPDITHDVNYKILEDLDFLYDIEDLIEELDSDFDIDKINSTTLETIRAQDNDKRIWGLPYQGPMYGLFFNKHIFDKFGVEYPTDNMTWQETVNLARQVTGEREGVNYRGIEIQTPNFLVNQFGINFTDPETAEVHIADEPAFIKTAELIDEIMNIPGIYTPGDEDEPEFFTRVGFDEGTTAMVVTWGAGYEWYHDSDVMNFDGVSLPFWNDIPNTDPMSIEGGPFTISAYSENKKEAFQVIEYLLSDEHQKWGATIGLMPVFENPSDDIINAFGEKLEDVEGKNIAGLFINTPASPPAKLSPWNMYVDVNKAFNDFINSDQDVNTFLREFQEQSEVNIKNAQESE